MSSSIVYPHGGGAVTITVGSGDKIAVYTKDTTKVYRQIGYPNQPNSMSLIGTVTNGQTVFGAYASGATIVLDGGAADTLYQVGKEPVITELKGLRLQGDPVALNATGTLTGADILGGIVTSTTASAVAATLDTGTVMDTQGNFAVGDSFDWTVINTGGSNAFTVTAATGHTIVGSGAVANSTSASFRTRKTAANTFITYRLT